MFVEVLRSFSQVPVDIRLEVPVRIKTINTKGEHQYVIVGHNDSVRVDRMKGYEAIHLLGFFMATSTACPDSSLWSASLTYLLRCLTLINFSTKNFRLRYLLVSCP